MSRLRAAKLAGAVLVAGLATWTGMAGAQNQRERTESALSDAQIESNVLKALANAPELAEENIQSSTSFGTVTLTGSVRTESARNKAEDLVSRATGVKKVVDEMTVGAASAQTASSDTNSAGDDAPELANMAPVDGPDQPATLDGRGAPQAQPRPSAEARNQPPADRAYDEPEAAQSADGSDRQAPPQSSYPPQPRYGQQSPYPHQPQDGQQPRYGNPRPPYGQGTPSYSDGSAPLPRARRPMYRNEPPADYAPEGGQRAGMPVTVPAGSLLRVRINRGVDSQHTQPGTTFDGIVLSDVAADGAIAIPRGATVDLVVVDAQKTGELSGKGQLALKVTGVSLGGRAFPLESDVWQRTGADKTARTVDSAVGLGALGAIVGAVAGGGPGAAVGAGVGAGVGVASSAGSPGGRVLVPAEAVLSFHTTQPADVRTVSEAEMQRLAYSAGPAQARPPQRRGYYPRPSPYPYPYYGPVYFYGR